jgi:hypothetical protein
LSSFSTVIKYETNLIFSSVFASNNLNSKNAFSLLSEVSIGGLILVYRLASLSPTDAGGNFSSNKPSGKAL